MIFHGHSRSIVESGPGIFRAKWSLDGDGIIEVEKDGNVVFQRHGANCYNNLLAPYLKFGAYAPT